MTLDKSYKSYINALKSETVKSRIKASLLVNRELLLLYWKIGKKILEMQEKEGWGAKLIEKISQDLLKEFPEMKGLSTTNLKRMRLFVQGFPSFETSAQPVYQLPWGHIVVLLHQVKEANQRDWYIKKTIENGWSRNVLVAQIESDLYGRQGKSH